MKQQNLKRKENLFTLTTNESLIVNFSISIYIIIESYHRSDLTKLLHLINEGINLTIIQQLTNSFSLLILNLLPI